MDTTGNQPGDVPAQPGDEAPEGRPQQPAAPPNRETPSDIDEVGRNLEAGLDEVKQYLGVLRRQNIAMSIKVARTERRIEELSARLEALGGSPSPNFPDPDNGGLAQT